jgi:hypothetical protein
LTKRKKGNKGKRVKRFGVYGKPVGGAMIDQILTAERLKRDTPQVLDRIGEEPVFEGSTREQYEQLGGYRDQIRGEGSELHVIKLIRHMITHKRFSVPVVAVAQAIRGLAAVDLWLETSDDFHIPLQVKTGISFIAKHANKYPTIPCVFLGTKTPEVLKKELLTMVEAKYADLKQVREGCEMDRSKKMPPSIGETRRTVSVMGNAPHSTKDLANFELLLQDLFAEINLGGDLELTSTGEAALGSADLQGISVSSKTVRVGVSFRYQPGDAHSRYKYHLHLPVDLRKTVLELLRSVCDPVWVSPPKELLPLPKLTEAPGDGYMKNAVWVNLALDHMEAQASPEGTITKKQALQVVNDASHHEKSFAGYGTLFGQMVGRGWLEKVDEIGDLYRIERLHPIASASRVKASKDVNSAAEPVSGAHPGYVKKFLGMSEVLTTYFQAIVDRLGSSSVYRTAQLTEGLETCFPEFNSEQAKHLVKNLTKAGYLKRLSMGKYQMTGKATALLAAESQSGIIPEKQVAATLEPLPEDEFVRMQTYAAQLVDKLFQANAKIELLEMQLATGGNTSSRAFVANPDFAQELTDFLAVRNVH